MDSVLNKTVLFYVSFFHDGFDFNNHWGYAIWKRFHIFIITFLKQCLMLKLQILFLIHGQKLKQMRQALGDVIWL